MERLLKIAKINRSYLEFRVDAFKAYGTDRAGMDSYVPYKEKPKGVKIKFLPRKNAFMKDHYMAESHRTAKELARFILRYDEITQLQVSGHAVFVSFNAPAQINTYINGQEADDRQRMRK